MRKLLTILFIVSVSAVQAKEPIPPAKGNVTITVKWSFKNIVEGYDHDTKTELYVDGKLMATSTVTKESQPNSVSAVVPKGQHKIKVVNYAYYDGVWEEHTIENTYSIDCLYEADINCRKKNNKVTLVFDIDAGTSVK